ncbi:Uncharacterized protein SCF082_LOCUS44137, partial [Durusdinium trenchii]
HQTDQSVSHRFTCPCDATGMSEVSRSNTNATNVSVASSGMDKGKKKESPRPVMIVIVLFLIVPSGITGYLSYLEGSACAVGRDNCKNECYESYVNADRQFQSQMKGEMECYDNCDADLVRCSAVSTNLVFGALFLAGGGGTELQRVNQLG